MEENNIPIEEEEVSIELVSEETKEVDVMEFSLDDEEIDEFVELLVELKESKSNFHFNVDDDNTLVVRHEEDESSDVEIVDEYVEDEEEEEGCNECVGEILEGGI